MADKAVMFDREPPGFAAMRTDLDHLPANKQGELKRVARIRLEEFEDTTKLGLSKTRKKWWSAT